jgi:hypothetical protein
MVVSVHADELIKFVCELRLPVLVDRQLLLRCSIDAELTRSFGSSLPVIIGKASASSSNVVGADQLPQRRAWKHP